MISHSPRHLPRLYSFFKIPFSRKSNNFLTSLGRLSHFPEILSANTLWIPCNSTTCLYENDDLASYAQLSWEQMVFLVYFYNFINVLWQEIVRHWVNIGWMNKWMSHHPIRDLKNCLEDTRRKWQNQICRKD